MGTCQQLRVKFSHWRNRAPHGRIETCQRSVPVLVRSLVLSLLVLLLPLAPARADCIGRDLLAELSSAERGALQAAADRHPYSRGLLFRATRGTEVVHLLGTLHMPDPRHAAMLARIDPLLLKSKTLLVEADRDQETRLKAEILKRPEFMFLTEGPKLNKLLPEADWKQVAARMQEQGIPPLMTARFRPWYLAVMLGMPPCATQSLKAGKLGLDHQIMARASEAGLASASLEPYDTLFKLFGNLTLEEELEMIRAALLLTADPADNMVTTINGYFTGETRLIWEFSRQQALASPGLAAAEVDEQFALMEEVLMTRRNRAWIPVILKAAQKGPVFAAFGALHLPGETGVLALLEAEGFAITRLD